MPKELHPYIEKHFDPSREWKYLIIGTFPPKQGCPKRTDLFPYFYGNEGSLWQILKETGLYPDFNFSSVDNIKAWQDAYSVGVTDVLRLCSRKEGKACSPSDSNLVIDLKTDLNFSLKEYILQNTEKIEKIYFTSASEANNSNSAYWLFTKLMGGQLHKVTIDKIVKLPSPSGEFLRTVFTKAQTNLGLKDYFYSYLEKHYPKALVVAKQTFEEKQSSPKKRINRKGEVVDNPTKRFPNCPNYPSMYRVDIYKSLLPKEKN
jgi:hypothetical protein